MHRLSSHFVLGYHGCDQEVAERLLEGEAFRASDREWDWLGPGIYFWEANPRRGLDWARELAQAGIVTQPAVVGAVIDLGLCLDMTTLESIGVAREAYETLVTDFRSVGSAVPTNGRSLMARRLDCAVIRQVHASLSDEAISLDTVRGVFVEGEPIYPGSGFDAKTHVQMPILGRVMEDDEGQYVVFPEGFTLDADELEFSQYGETVILMPVRATPETSKSEQQWR